MESEEKVFPSTINQIKLIICSHYDFQHRTPKLSAVTTRHNLESEYLFSFKLITGFLLVDTALKNLPLWGIYTESYFFQVKTE